MNKVSKFALAAGIVLAIAFIFSCSSLDDGDGGGGSLSSDGSKGNDIKNYRTVTIGNQIWMAENLNYAVEGSKCYGEGGKVFYDIESDYTYTPSKAEVQANCAKYGRLYDWATAMKLPSSCNSANCSNQIQSKHRGICPNGWHIPSNDDLNKLFRYVDNQNNGRGVDENGSYISYTAGRYLKATTGWNSNGNGTDRYGFSALPSGCGASDGVENIFAGGDFIGYWWSANESKGYFSNAYYRSILYNYDGIVLDDYGSKSFLVSVRCVRD